jgi:hypothetical protein
MFNHPITLYVVAFSLIFTGPSLTFGKGINISPIRQPARESAIYELSWMDMPLGRASVVWQESASSYQMSFQLRTTGIANLFGEQNLSAMVMGNRRMEGGKVAYTPSYYLARKQSDTLNETRIRYDEQGNVRQLSIMPPDDPTYRPRVSRGGMHSAYDPLTALLALLTGQRQFPLFDGKRLLQAHVESAPLTDQETRAGFSGLSVRRSPMEGHTEKELKRMKNDRPVLVIMQGGESRFPERLEADTRIGTLRATRQRTVNVNP